MNSETPEKIREESRPSDDFGLISSDSALGIYGQGEKFSYLLSSLAETITRSGRTAGTEVMRFPPVISRRTIELCGYFHTFPHLLGTIHSFIGDARQHTAVMQDIENQVDWGHHQALSDVVLTPAACYAVYPHLAGVLPAHGRHIDVESWCYRHEPSLDLGRMRAFRMREFVRIGQEESVQQWRQDWLDRAQGFLRALELDGTLVPATDPFFGPGARLSETV